MAQFRLSFKYQMAKRRSVRRSGFTLVEIAVALAIFVIGALAIIQIFPPALNVVRGSERRTTATLMSRGRITAYEDRAQGAPDAIYTTDPAQAITAYPKTWIDQKNPVTNNALIQTGGISSSTIPRGPTDNIGDTTLGNFKYIQGEKQKKRFRSNNGIAGSIPYVLTEFPYSGPVAVFVEEKINGVTIDANGVLNFTNATRATLNLPCSDTANTFPTRPRETTSGNDLDLRHNVRYYITYRYAQTVSGVTRIQGVVDEPLVIPPNGDASWASGLSNRVNQTTNVIPGSVSVRIRKLVYSDPAVLTVAPATTVTTRDEGYGGFVNLSSLTTLRPEFTEVSLDYTVADWRTMVWEEVAMRSATGATPNQVNVNVPMLNLDPDAGIVTLFERPPTGAETNPVLIWSLWDGNNNGNVVTDGSDRIVAGPDGVNTSAGRITFELFNPSSAVPQPPPPPTPTRTVFRTLDNWGHQLVVAASSYVPFPGAAPAFQHPREGWREYAWTPGTSVVYFQAAEAGKLVMVDYEYPDTSAPGGYRQVQGAIFPISLDMDGAFFTPPAGFAPTTSQAAAIKLTTLNGNVLASASAITAVRGVSIAARTAPYASSKAISPRAYENASPNILSHAPVSLYSCGIDGCPRYRRCGVRHYVKWLSLGS
jgi:prepilin-type N-terminal cleavage/methylation domain-containing protein